MYQINVFHFVATIMMPLMLVVKQVMLSYIIPDRFVRLKSHCIRHLWPLFFQLPDTILRNYGTELEFDDCPQLNNLYLSFDKDVTKPLLP